MPKVTVSQQQPIKIQNLSYGVRTLKGSTDLVMVNPSEGDVIVYKANTNSFVVEPIYKTNIDVDNGFF